MIGRNWNTLFFSALALIFHGFTLNTYAQTATINAGTVYQTIDGFGGENGGPWSWASSPFNWNSLTSSQADMLFSPTAGIGISIYRSDNVDGTSSTLPPEMTSIQLAYQRGAQIELSLQSPPSSMKYSGHQTFGDGTQGASGSCLAASNSTYATYIVQLIQNIQTSGSLVVSWVALQNEPNANSGTNSDGFGYCIWSPGALDSMAQALSSAISSAGLSTKIILGEAYNYANSANYFGTCISDSACKNTVSVVSGHGYGYPDSPVAPGSGGYPSLSSGYHIWQGETAPNGDTSFNPGMLDGSATGALTMAENMHNFLVTGQVSSYNWWELGYINNGGACQNCQLVDQNFNPTKRFYAFGNFSKFVRPGMVMIGATNNPQSGVYVSAYLNKSNGSFTIVVVNTNGSSVSQTFDLSGLSAGSVTPYVTDNDNNLASQTSVPVSGGSFTSTLTPSSVTTFVATGNGPGAPSHLAASVVQ